MKVEGQKFRIVQFYRNADGTKPVAEWLNGLDDERAQSIAIGVKFFEEYPNPVVPKKFFEKISEDIWEIKVHHGNEQFRLLAFMDDHSVVVAVHGFAKKSMGLKKQDVDLAEDRRKLHFERKKQKKVSK